MVTVIKTLLANYKTLFKAVLGLSGAFLIAWCMFLHANNKKLSDSLETALNNVLAYEQIASNSQELNFRLLLTVDLFKLSNDSLVQLLNTKAKENNIKLKQIQVAATQTQNIDVIGGKGVELNLIETLRDTTYTDSILYNKETKVYYTIGKDSVYVGIRLKNTQSLFIYTNKEWKNKKSFLKRLVTLDFKKVRKHKYIIDNSNDLVSVSDVRVVEIKQ